MRYGENVLTDGSGKTILKAFFSTVPKGKREFREHHHSECEISTIISGSGVYTVNKREYPFSAGDVFLFGGDEIHCLTDISDNFLLLNIQFEPRMLWSESDTFSALRIFFARNDSFENRIKRNSFTENIHKQIINLHTELSEKRDGYRAIVKYLLFSMLITLVREYNYVDVNEEYTYLENTSVQMQNAIDYINQNLENKLTLSDIAHHAAMSPTYFSAVFKKMNSLSPWEYITIKRVEAAISLLKSTKLTKLDIAQKCGFSSSSNFYKAFVSVTGKTPSNFCKKSNIL